MKAVAPGEGVGFDVKPVEFDREFAALVVADFETLITSVVELGAREALSGNEGD